MRCIIRKPLLTAVIVAACVAASGVAGAARAQTPAAPGDTIHADTSSRPTGTLRSGDLLKIRVYRDSELSGQYLIDAQGNVQMPGVGVIKAAGLDPTTVAGHSLRAGFAMTAAKNGKSLDAIMRQTLHKSEQVARGYIRHAKLFDDNAAVGLA